MHAYQRNRRGVALITVLFIVVVLLILIGSLLDLIPMELRDVAFTGYDNRALYAADAGVESLIEGLQQKLALGSGSLTAPDGTVSRYAASVLSTSTTCGQNTLKLVQSIGTSPAGDDRKVYAVVAQDTLSNYGLWVNNNPNGVYLVSGQTHYDGKIYLGGSQADPMLVDYIVGNNAIFDDQANFAGPVNWYNNGNQTSEPTQSNTQAWQAINSAGYAKTTLGANAETYPGSFQSIQLANDAWGTPSGTTYPSPTSKTVYLNQQAPGSGSGGNLTTGIYVQGDSTITMASSANGSSPSTMTWTFNPISRDSNSIVDPVTVAVNYTANTTVVTDTNTSKKSTYTGVPGATNQTSSNSGIVFDMGTIADVSGTYNGAYTLAVPDDGTINNNIYVANNIMAHDDPQTDSNSTDEFGLYANDVYLDYGKAPTNVQIEAALVTGNLTEFNNNTNDGTFTVGTGWSNSCRCFGGTYDVSNLPLEGVVTLFGALAENIYGATYTWSGNQHVTGWDKNFIDDPRFSTCPPPGSPVVPDAWHIVAWKDEGS